MTWDTGYIDNNNLTCNDIYLGASCVGKGNEYGDQYHGEHFDPHHNKLCTTTPASPSLSLIFFVFARFIRAIHAGYRIWKWRTPYLRHLNFSLVQGIARYFTFARYCKVLQGMARVPHVTISLFSSNLRRKRLLDDGSELRLRQNATDD